MIQHIYIFFQLLGHLIIYSLSLCNYFNYVLKASIYFNSWQLQIIYFTIFLPEIIYFKNIPALPPCRLNGGPLTSFYHACSILLGCNSKRDLLEDTQQSTCSSCSPFLSQSNEVLSVYFVKVWLASLFFLGGGGEPASCSFLFFFFFFGHMYCRLLACLICPSHQIQAPVVCTDCLQCTSVCLMSFV